MSEQVSITGKVEVVQEKQVFGSGFEKQVLVVNTGGDYPQYIPVEFVKDKTELLSRLSVGDDVEVFYNLRGNEYKGKYYANIAGWKIVQGAASGGGKSASDDSDDIPF